MKLQYQMENVGVGVAQIVDHCLENRVSLTQSGGILPIHSLLCESDYDIDTSTDTAEQSLTNLAKKQVLSAPYLIDLDLCLSWTDIYMWKVGDLKVFLKKLSQEKEEFGDVVFLEYKFNQFLKVSKSLTSDDFVDALKTLDSFQSMHALLSIIVGSPCVKDAPISLLENYIKTSFLHHCNSKNDFVSDSEEEGEEIVKFTLKCFVLLPFPILLNIAVKVFMSFLKIFKICLEIASS